MEVEVSAKKLSRVLEKVVADGTRGFLLLAREASRMVGIAYVATILSAEHCGLVAWLELLYLLGYHNGSQDALDWDFTAVVEGKFVKLGHGSTLLRSRNEFRAVPNINIVSAPLSLPKTQP